MDARSSKEASNLAGGERGVSVESFKRSGQGSIALVGCGEEPIVGGVLLNRLQLGEPKIPLD